VNVRSKIAHVNDPLEAARAADHKRGYWQLQTTPIIGGGLQYLQIFSLPPTLDRFESERKRKKWNFFSFDEKKKFC
jgi:hypothetical protein